TVNVWLSRALRRSCHGLSGPARNRPSDDGGDGGQSGDADDRISQPGGAGKAADIDRAKQEAQVSGRRYGGGPSAAGLWADLTERLAQQGGGRVWRCRPRPARARLAR